MEMMLPLPPLERDALIRLAQEVWSVSIQTAREHLRDRGRRYARAASFVCTDVGNAER